MNYHLSYGTGRQIWLLVAWDKADKSLPVTEEK